jgi:leucine dehydrogenase
MLAPATVGTLGTVTRLPTTLVPAPTELVAAGGHEQVVMVADARIGLRAMIAIHSTVLGPALGGVRFWHYASEHDALVDVLRLSAAMTMKAAVAGLRQGGGKAVVLWEPDRVRGDDIRRALGRAIDLLGGRYLAAEDVGATQADMDAIARETPWVTGIDPAAGGSGDPSPLTALGVVHAMEAAAEAAFGAAALDGLRVLVQGAGSVGAHLTRLLVDRGASVAVADVDGSRVAHVAAECDVDVVPPQHVLETECDVLAPCALGGVLTVDTVATLRCAVVCGAANNQLLDDAAGQALHDRGIVYAPDFVANAGGIVNIAQEWATGGYARARAEEEVARIGETTRRVLAASVDEGMPAGAAAVALARRRLAAEGSAPYRPGDPSVMRATLEARAARLGAR